MKRTCFLLALLFSHSLLIALVADAQNVKPKVTPLSVESAVTPTAKPTPIRNLEIPVAEITGVKLEAVSTQRIVYSEDVAGADDNKRLFAWEPNSAKLINLRLHGVPGSVRIAENGKYMVFLYDEISSNQDSNGDGVAQVVLRLYHFASGQVFNVGIPARSIKGSPSTFEYTLNDPFLAFTRSLTARNDDFQDDVPWQVIDLRSFTYAIEGTPTPSATPTPPVPVTPSPTPTLDPSVTPSPYPTVPPNTRERADINGDEEVNMLDLLLFQMFWSPQGKPTPTPTVFVFEP